MSENLEEDNKEIIEKNKNMNSEIIKENSLFKNNNEKKKNELLLNIEENEEEEFKKIDNDLDQIKLNSLNNYEHNEKKDENNDMFKIKDFEINDNYDLKKGVGNIQVNNNFNLNFKTNNNNDENNDNNKDNEELEELEEIRDNELLDEKIGTTLVF